MPTSTSGAGKGALAKLIIDDEIGKATRSISRMIWNSFRTHPSRKTQAEIKRRFEICISIYKQCRGDLKFSTERALDNIPAGLAAKLDGAPWEPQTRDWWFGHDKAELAAGGIAYSEIDSDDAPFLWTPERARLGIV